MRSTCVDPRPRTGTAKRDRRAPVRPVAVARPRLALTAAGLLLLAACRPSAPDDDGAAVQSRIAPEGAVYVGADGERQRAAAASAGTGTPGAGTAAGDQTGAAAANAGTAGAGGPQAPSPGTAAAPPADGRAVYDGQCFACHASGVGNAPTLDHAHWEARLAQGRDVLYRHAIDGYIGPDGGVMPPRGGNPALDDAQVHAAVDWMLASLEAR